MLQVPFVDWVGIELSAGGVAKGTFTKSKNSSIVATGVVVLQ
jgi:hypothetical protein